MRRLLVLPCALLAVGCGDFPNPLQADPTPAPTAPTPSAPAAKHDATQTGTISGRVVWHGQLPDVPTPNEARHGTENPNRPHIDPKTKAVRDAVVFVRGADATASRPWDHPPVRVEMGDGKITVVQGERRGRVGFVRRGDSFTAVSHDPNPQVLRGRGDAFFGLPLPERDRPTTRALTTPGRVELSSGTGLLWARADLFVSDHPYFTLTDADGNFTLDRVPAGRVEVVAWLPGWGVARKERDAETTAFVRMWYSPPVERVVATVVESGRTAEVRFAVP